MESARLTAERDAPRDRPAPIMTDDREFTDAERVGEREDVGDQLVGRVGFGIPRLRRAAIAALVGRDAAKVAREVRQLIAPGAVRFGKAVEEDEDRRVARSHVDDVELDSGRKLHPLLFEIVDHSPWLLWFRFETNLARIGAAGKLQQIGIVPKATEIAATSVLGWEVAVTTGTRRQ